MPSCHSQPTLHHFPLLEERWSSPAAQGFAVLPQHIHKRTLTGQGRERKRRKFLFCSSSPLPSTWKLDAPNPAWFREPGDVCASSCHHRLYCTGMQWRLVV